MTHADIINRWPTLTAFAEDIGVTYVTAKAMRRRGSIPSGYWVRVITAAQAREIEDVTFKVLAELVAIPQEAAE